MIRKFTLFFLMLFACLAEGFAIPAYPGKMKAPQADGTMITIQRLGDEYCHMTVSDDGYPLLFNVATRNYEYASLEDGQLKASGIIATDPELRSSVARQFLSTVDKEQVMTQFSNDWGKALKETSSRYDKTTTAAGGPKRIVRISDVPTTGQHDVLVILVQFSDRKFTDDDMMTDPADYYDRFFHEEGFSSNGARGSAYDFYRYGSNYRYDPQFKVYGPVTLSGTHTDYAGTGGSALTYKLIQEAVPMVDSLYDVDFRSFDTDSDGVVDNVYCLYAGYGQADSYDSQSIWPHSYNLDNSSADHSFRVDGVKIDRYTVSQEINGQSSKPVGIGTFVHEFGHVLGFADHYNNSSRYSNPTNNVGNWDVMASGSYNGDQNCPPTFSAFERYSLGWTEPAELDPVTDTLIDIHPYEGTQFLATVPDTIDGVSQSQSYRVSISGKDNEYFLIENRQKKGWDEYLPGHGILVWHIDENQSVWDDNSPNADATHQRVDIVEAGQYYTSTGSSSDAFPGARNVTAYNFTAWNSRRVFGFAWLRECADSLCQFLLTNTDYRLQSPTLEVGDVMGTTARLTWGESELATNYNVFVVKDSIVAGSTTATEPGSFDVSGLEPETDYTAQVVATLSSLRSDTVSVPFTTLTRQIEERVPQVIGASDATTTSFTANWVADSEADNYLVTLFSRHHDGVGSVGTGFDNYTRNAPNLPEGWYMTDYRSGYTRYYGESSPAVRLSLDSSMLVASVPNQKIESASFWYRATKAGVRLSVDKFADGEWTNIWNYVDDRARNLRDSLTIGGADSLRFVLTRDSGVTGGYVFLDDVYLTYLYDQYDSLATVSTDGNAANDTCSYAFRDLDADKEYAFSVQAQLGDRLSIVSDTVNVVVSGLIDGITRVSDDSGTNASGYIVYDLQGRRVATVDAYGRLNATVPKGIYIVGGKKIAVK